MAVTRFQMPHARSAQHLSLQTTRVIRRGVSMDHSLRRDFGPKFVQGHSGGLTGSGVAVTTATDSGAETHGQLGIEVPMQGDRHTKAFIAPKI